jgi:hypothetical protein
VYCSTRAYLFVNLLSSLNWPWFCSDAWQDFWRIFNRPWFPSLLWFRFVLPNMTSAFCFVFPHLIFILQVGFECLADSAATPFLFVDYMIARGIPSSLLPLQIFPTPYADFPYFWNQYGKRGSLMWQYLNCML